MADGCHLKTFFAITQQPISAKFCLGDGEAVFFSQNFGNQLSIFNFCFPNDWASASDGFRIVSDTLVL